MELINSHLVDDVIEEVWAAIGSDVEESWRVAGVRLTNLAAIEMSMSSDHIEEFVDADRAKVALDEIRRARTRHGHEAVMAALSESIHLVHGAPPACAHQWEEQPGEPPCDVCFHCGAVRM
jgi:hypothetical protein